MEEGEVSREIKFRAWDGERMNYAPVLHPIPHHGTYKQSHFIYLGDKQTEMELMQYTGLKDKNGVEIYEGDIVAWHYPDDYQPAELATTIAWVGRCFYDQTRCAFEVHAQKNGGGFYHSVSLTHCKQYSVVGNIHQNPDLLK